MATLLHSAMWVEVLILGQETILMLRFLWFVLVLLAHSVWWYLMNVPLPWHSHFLQCIFHSYTVNTAECVILNKHC